MNDVTNCEGCGSMYYKHTMNEIDVSLEYEYYPKFIYVCNDCFDSGSK